MLCMSESLLNKFSVINCLKELRSTWELGAGKRVHACIQHTHFNTDVAVVTALLCMYGNCGCTHEAFRLFETMMERNTVTWNALISICVRHGDDMHAQRLFQQMLLEGFVASSATFVSTLKAASGVAVLNEGRSLHTRIIASTLDSDVIVANALLTMYSKCGRAEDVQRVFLGMPQRNVVSWTILITFYLQQGNWFLTLHIFYDMQDAGAIPNSFTFVSLLSACANARALAQGKWVHQHVVFHYVNPDAIIVNALLQVYSECGSLEDACKLLEDTDKCDVISWTTIIAAYSQRKLSLKAQQIYRFMQDRGVFADNVCFVRILDTMSGTDAVVEGRRIHVCVLSNGFEQDASVGVALVNMYGRCGLVETAWCTFDRMPDRTVVAWNSMIAVFSQHGEVHKVLQLFHQMHEEGLVPDKATFVGILDACSNQINIVEGKCMHMRIFCSGFRTDLALGTGLLHMYGKYGDLEKARSIFDTTSEQDTASWNAMIGTLSQHGKGEEAIELLHQMQLNGAVPDKVTFMSILLACDHCGLVDEGCKFFFEMENVWGVQPDVEHFNCMVDLLGRAGCLDEAMGLVERMLSFSNATTWTALSGGCKMHGYVEQGNNAARTACELDPMDAGTYILLSNIHISGSMKCEGWSGWPVPSSRPG